MRRAGKREIVVKRVKVKPEVFFAEHWTIAHSEATAVWKRRGARATLKNKGFSSEAEFLEEAKSRLWRLANKISNTGYVVKPEELKAVVEGMLNRGWIKSGLLGRHVLKAALKIILNSEKTKHQAREIFYTAAKQLRVADTHWNIFCDVYGLEGTKKSMKAICNEYKLAPFKIKRITGLVSDELLTKRPVKTFLTGILKSKK